MGKSEVLAAFEDDLANPGSWSGEALRDYVTNSTARFLRRGDRAGVVEALREWMGQESVRMLAMDVAAVFRLTELRPVVEALRAEVPAGAFFAPHDLQRIERALALMNDGKVPSF